MDAKSLGFQTGIFDIALCGFMGWDDCFDFVQGQFTRSDTKAKEIWRVLRDGGVFLCCSWDEQEDVSWMEEAVIRYHPAILEDREYLERRPIGMAHEKAEGYEIIFRHAGFRDVAISREAMTFVSTDEEEWWRQMQQVGWDPLLRKIESGEADRLREIKESVFKDLQHYRQDDGICFDKAVFFVRGVK
jgi:SAM-dependent methyltransferase